MSDEKQIRPIKRVSDITNMSDVICVPYKTNMPDIT